MIALVVIVAIFGFWIPQFADYSDVWPLLKDLTAGQWLALAVAQFLNLATYWLVYMAALPGLTFWQACVSVQTNSSIASVLPAGGAFAIGITYQFLGSWGFTPGETTELIGVSGFWNFGCKLLMPVLAVLLLLASGEKSHTLVVAALIGLAVCIVAGVVIGLSLWKETIARSIGRWADHAVSWVLRPFHKNTGDALERMLIDFRHQTIDVARTRWWFLTWSSISSQLAAFLVFTLSMRFVGITSGQVSLVEMFAAFCFGMLVGSIPITPGGLGDRRRGLHRGRRRAPARRTRRPSPATCCSGSSRTCCRSRSARSRTWSGSGSSAGGSRSRPPNRPRRAPRPPDAVRSVSRR